MEVRFRSLRELLRTLTEYYKIASDTMVRVDPGTNERFAKELAELPSLIDTAEKTRSTAGTLAQHLTASAQLEHIIVMLFGLASIINTPYYEEKLTMSKSVGFQTQIREYIARITGIITTYKNRATTQDQTEIPEIVKGLKLSDPVSRDTAIKDILNTPTPSKLLIEVAKAVIVEDPTAIKQLSPHIDALKTSILGGLGVIEAPTQPQASSIEPWLTYMCDLIPSTLYVTAAELCVMIDPKYVYDTSASPHDNFIAISGENSTLWIPRTASREVDYCVSPLIDPVYIEKHQLVTNPQSGINKKVVKRFSSLRDIPGGTASGNPVFTMKGPECYVVCELGGHVRLVSQSMSKLTIPTELAARMLKPLSDRPLNYNEIITGYVLSIGEALEYRLLIKWYEDARLSADVQTADFKVSLLKKLVDGVSIDPLKHNSVHGFTTLCENSYQQPLIGETMKLLGERNISGREKRSTFTIRMSGLINAFNQSLESIIKSKLTPSLFTTRGDVNRHLIGLYSDVMKATIEDLDKPPSKFLQLGITLKEHFIKTRGGVAV